MPNASYSCTHLYSGTGVEGLLGQAVSSRVKLCQINPWSSVWPCLLQHKGSGLYPVGQNDLPVGQERSGPAYTHVCFWILSFRINSLSPSQCLSFFFFFFHTGYRDALVFTEMNTFWSLIPHDLHSSNQPPNPVLDLSGLCSFFWYSVTSLFQIISEDLCFAQLCDWFSVCAAANSFGMFQAAWHQQSVYSASGVPVCRILLLPNHI